MACVVDGCGGKVLAKGLCSLHYQRLKTGKPLSDPPKTPRGTRTAYIESLRAADTDDCIIWPFGLNRYGRGYMAIKGRSLEAHRAVCIAINGQPPTPKHEVAHSCGKGHLGCINPKHLSWKTHTENEADKLVHGTRRRGTTIPWSLLTERQVLDIRKRNANGEKQTWLAREYGTSDNTIGKICRGETWAWLEDSGRA